MTVMERRAEFVYEGARIAAIAAGAPIIPALWSDREEPFRAQFMEIITRQCGPSRSTSPAELHGSWMQAYIDMGWRYGPVYDPEAKTHPDMVPYDQLGLLEQDKDEVFVALCEIARQWVRDDGDRGDTGPWWHGRCREIAERVNRLDPLGDELNANQVERVLMLVDEIQRTQ